MQEVLKCRCQENSEHRQKENPAEQCVSDGKYFSPGSRNPVNRSYAGKDHRGVQGRVEPVQSGEYMVACRAEPSQCSLNWMGKR